MMLEAPGDCMSPGASAMSAHSQFDSDFLQGLMDSSMTTGSHVDHSAFFPASGMVGDPFEWLNDDSMATDGAAMQEAMPGYFSDYVQQGNGDFRCMSGSVSAHQTHGQEGEAGGDGGASGSGAGQMPWMSMDAGVSSPEQQATPGLSSSSSSRESSNSVVPPPMAFDATDAPRMTFVVDEAPPETLVEVMRVLMDSKARVEFKRG